MTYIFQEEAEEEFLDQISFYRKIHPAVAQKFSFQVKETIQRIIAFPEAWPKIDDSQTRRVLVNGFPFSILYYFNKKRELIRIIAVMNNSRKPGYWRNC